MNTNPSNSSENSDDPSCDPKRKPTFPIPVGIEPWQLTAYALGELEPESRAQVESWIGTNPAAAAEVQAIRDTAATVQKQLASSTLSTGLDSRHTEHVHREISANNNRAAIIQVQKSDGDEIRMKRMRRYRTLGLIASGLAASVVGVRLYLSVNDQPEIHSGTDLVYRFPEIANRAEPPAEVKERIREATANGGASGHFRKSQSAEEALGLTDNEVLSQEYDFAPAKGMKSIGERRGRQEKRESVALEGNPSEKLSDRLSMATGPAQDLSKDSSPRPSVTASAASSPAGPVTLESRTSGGGLGYGGFGGRAFGGGGGLGGQPGASGGVAGADVKASEDFSGAMMPFESSGDRGLQIRDANRMNQIPEELKANVPSFRNPTVNAGGDRFETIVETPFAEVAQSPQSTFSIDVDTASYSKVRQYVMKNVVPNPSAVRIEEMINYFDYNYPGPKDDSPFAAHMKMAICPWNTEHRLVRVAIQAKKVNAEHRPASNLVFLIDVSGSMADANKLPLVKRTLTMLASQLREQDRVAIVVYAGAAGCVLPSTSGASKDRILASIDELQSGGSTNGGQGIELAYRIARENYVEGGINRVLLCTDGDFNVGVTGTDQLVAMMQENAKSNVFLTCLGYGIGNYNDSMMEQISNKGNGNYGMVDSEAEARKIMIEQISGTLMTVAKDVKIQVEFNPYKVASYRLIGYENRRLATQDFDNDKKDAGEIGAGHRVTALYEIVPVGKDGAGNTTNELRYGKKQPEAPAKPIAETELAGELANEWMLLKIRSKQPEATESSKQEFVLKDGDMAEEAYPGERADMDWAVSVAEFGLLLRHSQLATGIDWDRMISRAQESVGDDSYRRECLAIMQQAKKLIGK